MREKYGTSIAGQFDSSMAEYVYYNLCMNGDFGDDEASNGMGDWANQYGKRILSGDSQGFIYLTRHDTVAEAEAVMVTMHDELEPEDEPEDPWEAQGSLVDMPAKAAGYEGVAWRIDQHSLSLGRVKAHMIGDDRTFEFDAEDVTVIEEEEYCGSCGQIGCGWGHRAQRVTYQRTVGRWFPALG